MNCIEQQKHIAYIPVVQLSHRALRMWRIRDNAQHFHVTDGSPCPLPTKTISGSLTVQRVLIVLHLRSKVPSSDTVVELYLRPVTYITMTPPPAKRHRPAALFPVRYRRHGRKRPRNADKRPSYQDLPAFSFEGGTEGSMFRKDRVIQSCTSACSFMGLVAFV
jgi:hypothetical protein